MKTTKKYTVITGASQGLGRALAIACAERGMNMILVSLPDESIKETTEFLKVRYSIDAIHFETNLIKEENVAELVKWINQNYAIDMLINNAGIGGSKEFNSASKGYIDSILLLNIRALVLLTHGLLPNLKKQNNAYILNIASLASFGPFPFKTVYPASKAFVYSFSRGLSAELKESNVVVSVAHPGGMATNKDVSERIAKYNDLIKATILSAEETAEICVRQLLKKDELIIPGIMNKLSYAILKICPVWMRLEILRRSLQKELSIQNQPVYA